MYILLSSIKFSVLDLSLLKSLCKGLLLCLAGGAIILLSLTAKADYRVAGTAIDSPSVGIIRESSSPGAAKSVKHALEWDRPSFVGEVVAAADVERILPEDHGYTHYANWPVTPDRERNFMLALVPNGSPLKHYRRISSEFGMRQHPLLKKRRAHHGMDYSVASGTPVYGTAPGTVVVAETSKKSSYGRHVIIRHALGFSTLYAHLDKVDVTAGDKINKGAVIGLSGNTGRSSKPHLHYEIKYLDQALNPKSFTEWSTENYYAIFSKEKTVPWASIRKQQDMFSTLAHLSLPLPTSF